MNAGRLERTHARTHARTHIFSAYKVTACFEVGRVQIKTSAPCIAEDLRILINV